MKFRTTVLLVTFFSFLLWSCNSSEKDTLAVHSEIKFDEGTQKNRTLSQDFKKYWYDGKAELTSFKISQERYGELREGTSVHIFVAEDFLPNEQVKANNASEENTAVLKFNATKKYLTGIYPYSVMTSVFNPVETQDHSIKVAHSMQEWCGQVYFQLNNKEEYEIWGHSYFEGEADQQLNLPKTWLESELWSRIRINPEELPTGDFTMLPSFEYFRMSHQKIGIHTANGNLVKGDSISTYSLSYTDLDRELKIYFTSTFPYSIERWEETHANGLTSTGEKLKRIKTAYWRQNSNEYIHLRDSLSL